MSPRSQSLQLHKPQACQAAGRSGLYALLAGSLEVPDENFFHALHAGQLAASLSPLLAALPYPLPAPDFSALPRPDFVAFHADYLACFEVSPKGPACPLYEGAFRQDRGRKAVMEELLRFYHYFDLQMSETLRELPDHLRAELEFMHYLAFLEAKLLEQAQSPRDLLYAQRDFLSRHPAAWIPALARKAAAQGAPAFYSELLQFLAAFLLADLRYLEEQLAGIRDPNR